MFVCFKTCNVQLNLIDGYELHSSVSLIIPSMPATGAIVGQDSCASFAIHCIVALKGKVDFEDARIFVILGHRRGKSASGAYPTFKKG